MKRALSTVALFAAMVFSIPAQEPEKKTGTQESKEVAGDPMLGWKWANFGLLALGLGYMMAKTLPPFFRSRNEEIRKGIDEAAKQKAEAEAKVAEIERKLAGLGVEIDQLRGRLKSELSAEGDRIQQETVRLAQRIHAQAEQDIAFLTKSSRLELKSYAAALALDLARDRIRARMNPDEQHSLVEAFAHDLRSVQ